MMKQKSHLNPVNIGIILFALLFSAILCLALYSKMMPLKFHLKQRVINPQSTPILFRDFNYDGYSERYSFHYRADDVHYILFNSSSGAIIDQFNIRETIKPEWVFFGDYNGDGYEDCFVFTLKADSLFLYAFDIAKPQPILIRHYLMHIPNPHPIFNIPDAALYDLNGDYKPKLLFLVNSGLALKPRGLYVFDLQKKQIIKRFENNANKNKLIIYDLNGDGKDEIIIATKASGNTPKDTRFTDWKNWLFILDHNLNLLKPPLSYGGFPSIIKILPIQIKDKRFLLISHDRAAQKYQRKALGLYLVNSQNRFQVRRYFFIKDLNNMLVNKKENANYIFISDRNGRLLRFDNQCNLTKEKKTNYSNFYLSKLFDVNGDGNPELITRSTTGVQIFDENLNLLAETKVKGPGFISIQLRGPNQLPGLGVNGLNEFYHFYIVKNPWFSWMPVVFLALFILLMLLLFFANWLVAQILTYFSYFNYSLRKTPNSVILLNPNGNISYFNSRVQQLLHPVEPLLKKKHYRQIFSEYPDILHCIDESMKHKKAVKRDFNVNQGNREIKGQLSVIPFKTSFNYIYAYMLEIRDLTQPILSDRHRTWSRTVRKMAHDIKTPLGSVMLNIERIQQKIQDLAPQALTQTDSDFKMTISEIKRIQAMTKNFLKFTNLEEPNLQPIQLEEILQNILLHFAPYLNEHLKIELNLEQKAHTLIVDPKQLEMALQIFIENSIDALKGNGKILISSALAQNLENYLENELEIEIADNGPGISDDAKNQIFEPFFTTKKDGTGMGLAIAKKIINDHGGRVEVISKKQFGAVFRIVLPVKLGAV